MLRATGAYFAAAGLPAPGIAYVKEQYDSFVNLIGVDAINPGKHEVVVLVHKEHCRELHFFVGAYGVDCAVGVFHVKVYAFFGIFGHLDVGESFFNFGLDVVATMVASMLNTRLEDLSKKPDCEYANAGILMWAKVSLILASM